MSRVIHYGHSNQSNDQACQARCSNPYQQQISFLNLGDAFAKVFNSFNAKPKKIRTPEETNAHVELNILGGMFRKLVTKVVKKEDGSRPTIGAIKEAADTYLDTKGKRGRKKGDRATTKEEDKKIMKTFFKMRPPGHGVDSQVVHLALPKKIQKKIKRRTIIRRLAEKGYVPEHKINKKDTGTQCFVVRPHQTQTPRQRHRHQNQTSQTTTQET